jgi:menaquinone-dependent protoporphyrinogen oxidase
MVGPVLVTYASRHGSTAGVAQAIGTVLAQRDWPVEVRAMESVSDLTRYGAVVAGSAIQNGAWLPEALEFVRRHRPDLDRRPFAAFLVCMTLAMEGSDYQDHVRSWFAPVRRIVTPVCEGAFPGELRIASLPSWGDRLKFRISVWAGVWSEGDHRDWEAIRSWADGVAVAFSATAG